MKKIYTVYKKMKEKKRKMRTHTHKLHFI